MNRRDFLKAGLAAVAVAALPKLDAGPRMDIRLIETPGDAEIHRWADFNPDQLYGNGIMITDKPTPEMSEKLITLLYEDMVKWVPPEYREKVEIHGPIPDDFGRAVQIHWRYES